MGPPHLHLAPARTGGTRNRWTGFRLVTPRLTGESKEELLRSTNGTGFTRDVYDPAPGGGARRLPTCSRSPEPTAASAEDRGARRELRPEQR